MMGALSATAGNCADLHYSAHMCAAEASQHLLTTINYLQQLFLKYGDKPLKAHEVKSKRAVLCR